MAESFNDFVAGWIGGAAGIIVGSPLDVLKARLQAPVQANTTIGTTVPATTERMGSWQTLKSMIQTEGLGSMFKGVLSPVVGLAGLNALLFVSYGSILRYFETQSQSQYPLQYPLQYPPQQPFEPSLLQVYIAGAGAGFACFFFSTPTDLIKIKAQMTKIPKTTYQVTREIFQSSGLRGFYQGGVITMIRDAPSYGIYFWVYEGMKRVLETKENNEAWRLLLAGGLAGTVSWASIYPIDVVKSRLQMQQQQQQQQQQLLSTNEANKLLVIDRPYASIKDCVVRSYQTEGPKVFFRGLWPTLLRGFPVNAVTFYIYEIVMNFLSK